MAIHIFHDFEESKPGETPEVLADALLLHELEPEAKHQLVYKVVATGVVDRAICLVGVCTNALLRPARCPLMAGHMLSI